MGTKKSNTQKIEDDFMRIEPSMRARAHESNALKIMCESYTNDDDDHDESDAEIQSARTIYRALPTPSEFVDQFFWELLFV